MCEHLRDLDDMALTILLWKDPDFFSQPMHFLNEECNMVLMPNAKPIPATIFDS